jgi:hypothetical protein
MRQLRVKMRKRERKMSFPDTEEVTGSNPVRPTTQNPRLAALGPAQLSASRRPTFPRVPAACPIVFRAPVRMPLNPAPQFAFYQPVQAIGNRPLAGRRTRSVPDRPVIRGIPWSPMALPGRSPLLAVTGWAPARLITSLRGRRAVGRCCRCRSWCRSGRRTGRGRC